MHRTRLSTDELHCLRLIASGADGQQGCSRIHLDVLVGQGLVEAVPRWAFPGLSPVIEYRITAAGRQLLNA